MTKKMTNNDISKNSRDEAMGRALAAIIAEQEVTGSCLTDEDMAATIDGSLSDPERDLFMKHLSSCETCFKVYSTSQKLMANKTVPSQKNRFVLPSVGLAIAALLAIILKISLQGDAPDKPVMVEANKPSVSNAQKQGVVPSPVAAPSLPGDGVVTAYSPPSAAEVARLLVRGSDVKLLLAAAASDRSQVYGFSGAVSDEKRAFRLGVQAADLELLLQANERDVAVAHLKQMVTGMPTANLEQSAFVRFENIIRQIEKGLPLKNYRNCTAAFEKTVAAKDELFLYRFGIWAEGGRLAATVGNKGYFDVSSLQYVMVGVKDMQLPAGLLKSLQDVEGIVVKGAFADKDFLVMKRAFEDVTTIF